MGKFSLKKGSREPIMSREDAEKQFITFIEHYEIDLDSAAETMSERTGRIVDSDTLGDEFVDLIETGEISIEENGDHVAVVQHLREPIGDHKTLTYGKVTGRVRKAMGRGEKEGSNIALLFALCSALIIECAGDSDSLLLKLGGKDSTTMKMIGNLYLLF